MIALLELPLRLEDGYEYVKKEKWNYLKKASH